MVAKWKIFFVTMLSVLSLLILWPTFLSPQQREKLPAWLPHKAMVMGLDLQGGVHLLLELDTKELLTETYEPFARSMRNELHKQKIFYRQWRKTQNGIDFILKDAQQAPKVKQISEKILKNEFQIGFSPKENNSSHVKVAITLINTEKAKLFQQALSQSISVVRRRIDETGALEPLIQSQGNDRIIVQIPGSDNPARVRALLGKTAKLSFRWVEEEGRPALMLPTEGGGTLPVGQDILLTGSDVLEANAQYVSDDFGQQKPVLTFTLTRKGAHIFSELTRDHIGKKLAIVLDQKVLSAPSIKTHIPDGQGSIDGMKSLEEAQKLALMLRSGALPTSLKVLEEKVVGPGLGYDSIVAGTRATVLAVAAVALWMLAIYSFFGIFAVLGIGFNLCFLLAALVLLGATLTLPGLAGIALTVGMSVDANVLINERIREELRMGARPQLAIRNGYNKAMSSIMDSNVTTLIGMILLYVLGSGPVRGFAIAMGLGILISLFTAIGLTRMWVYVWLEWKKPTILRI